MDIGTAKPSTAMRQEVPHHLIDLVEPEDDLPVAVFQQKGREVLDDIAERKQRAIICGGSGLHFRSLIDPLQFPPSDPEVRRAIDSLDDVVARLQLERIDPGAAEHVDMANPRRVARALEIAEITGLTPSARSSTREAEAVRNYKSERDVVVVGVDPGDELVSRVERRFDEMLRRGLLDEVALLQDRMGRLARQAVGYKELLPVVAGRRSMSEGRAAAISATRALAKRQRTFFRRDPRINWITWDRDSKKLLDRALTVLKDVA